MDTVIPLSLLLADEMALVRDGLAAICQSSHQYRIIAQCSDGHAAWDSIQTLRPDIAILDLSLTELSTLELISRVRNAQIPTRLVVIASRLERSMLVEALRQGADGYVLKSCPGDQLLAALQHVSTGGVYLSPALHVDDFSGGRLRRSCSDPLQLLSTREFQVFTLLVDGIRAKEIASRLELSPKTVDTHRASLMRKLKIHDVAGLVKFAITRKLTPVA